MQKKKKNAWIWSQKCRLVYFSARILKTCCDIWNQYPRICLFNKFHEKRKMRKFGIKKASFEYFWARIWKQYCHIWNQHLQQKCPSFRPKVLNFEIFELEFEKDIVIFEISTFQFVWWQNFLKKQTHLNLGLKMPYLGIFGQEFKKKLFHIWNQHYGGPSLPIKKIKYNKKNQNIKKKWKEKNLIQKKTPPNYYGLWVPNLIKKTFLFKKKKKQKVSMAHEW